MKRPPQPPEVQQKIRSSDSRGRLPRKILGAGVVIELAITQFVITGGRIGVIVGSGRAEAVH